MCDMSHNHNQFHQPDSKEILHSNVMQVLACVTLAKGGGRTETRGHCDPSWHGRASAIGEFLHYNETSIQRLLYVAERQAQP